MFDLDPVPQIITFDCYGTLVQWEEVLLHEIGAILMAHGREQASAASVLETYSARERALEAEKPHRLFRDILRTGFRAAFEDHGLDLTADAIEGIVSSLQALGPHPEVPDALRRLRERYKLAIVTNSDEDLIAPVVARIGVPFDYVITAERAQAYKPSHRIFDEAYRVMGVAGQETVHVAMGMYWDMKACHELGLRGIWVNRLEEAGNPDWLPYEQVADLDDAAALLLPS